MSPVGQPRVQVHSETHSETRTGFGVELRPGRFDTVSSLAPSLARIMLLGTKGVAGVPGSSWWGAELKGSGTGCSTL